MSVEVVVPALRQKHVERLVESLAYADEQPDLVSIISNEVQSFKVPRKMPVRLVRFSTSTYSIGERDVALRTNVGFWSAEKDIIITQGDDQIVPPSFISDCCGVICDKQYAWGNHRLIDFENRSVENIRHMESWRGISREDPTPPALHGFYSCYGGMFVVRRDFILEMGGIDMVFNGRHAGEDQQLGYRLMRHDGKTQVPIFEPPFAWHDISLKFGDTRPREPYLQPAVNGCGPGKHEFVEAEVAGLPFQQCMRCVFSRYTGPTDPLFRDEVIIEYRPEVVQTQSVWL